MSQSMADRTRQLAAADVLCVRHHARAVITIDQQTVSSRIGSDQSKLDVVAVVGPTEFDGLSLPEAVLCEVGLHRARPYARSERRGPGAIRPYLSLIQPRHPRFALSAWQYRLAAPALFLFLDGWMHEVVGRWFWGPQALLRIRRTFVRGPKFTLEQADQYVTQPRGCRISVARKDIFLCADLFRSEMCDPFWQEQLGGLASMVELALKPLESGYREPFRDNERVREVRAMLQARTEVSMPTYVMATLPRFLGLNERRGAYPLVGQVADLVADVTGIRNGGPSWQERVAASALPGFQDRAGGIMARDITSLRFNGSSGDKPYIVFELLPEARKKFRRPRVGRKTRRA